MAFPAATAAGALTSLASGKNWEERLRKGTYTTPGGTRMDFAFEDLQMEFEKRTTAFPVLNVKNDYVQDNGHGSRKYQLRCFFSGDNHDLLSQAFVAGLAETGNGKLEHPRFGTLTVVPFGTITWREDLKRAANQSIVEVTFWTTTGAVYPSVQSDPASEIGDAAALLRAASSSTFAGMNLKTGLRKSGLIAGIRSALQSISSALSKVSGAVASVNRQFRELESAIHMGLDVLVGQPLFLAQQLANLVTAPARALKGLESRIDELGGRARRIFGSGGGPAINEALGSYRNLLTSTLASSAPSNADQAASEEMRIKAQNQFRLADHIALSAIAGSVEAVVNYQFSTKPEALSAAEEVLTQLEEAIAWREQRFEELGLIDTGEAYQQLQEAVALTAGYLVQISFTLVPEKAVVLDRERSIIELCAELYGTVEDEQLDFFIASNDFTGSQILLLERGTKVKYYPTPAAA